MDGDSRPDLVVAHFGGGVISVFRNVSVPGALPPDWFAPRVDFPVGDAYTVAVGDTWGNLVVLHFTVV